MTLSVIIVNFNTKEFLKNCLCSVFQSLKRASFDSEIIIVDNGSTDGSRKFLKKLQNSNIQKLQTGKTPIFKNSKHPRIKVIFNKKNLGFAKANNQGIRESKGKYVLLLNPDTVLLPKTIPYLLNFMEKEKKIGVVTCRVELPDGSLDDACHRGFPTPWNAFCHFSGLARLFSKSRFFNGYHLGYQNLNKIHEIDACAGAFMLIRRKTGEEVNWLDEDYFWYGEDLDFCYRVKEKGWKVMFIPQVKIIHYKGAASGIKKHSQGISTADKATRKKAQRARFKVMRIFYQKHYQKKYPFLVGLVVKGGIRVLSLIVNFTDQFD